MLILGIESTCDETSASLVRDGKEVLSCVIASSVEMHAKIGGVVPEVAARDHVVKIVPVIEEAMEQAGVIVSDIDAIAVANGPGLIGSLLSGVLAAQVLGWMWQKPVIPVHHIAGHIYANWIDLSEEVSFPALILTVSGGHNELVLMRGHHDFEIVGETLDDAAGEAFDKIARLLDLGFPGGPAISQAATHGDPTAYDLPRPMLQSGDFNFSFSGLKTAVRVALGDTDITKYVQHDMAASFEEAATDVLVAKLRAAADAYSVREIHLSGGVSANRRLRTKTQALADENGLVLRFPEKILYCTDNAAMIAAAAFYSPRSDWKQWNEIEPHLSFEFK